MLRAGVVVATLAAAVAAVLLVHGLSGAPARAGRRAAPARAVPKPILVLRYVDRSRSARLSTGEVVPRTLVTYVRRPATGRPPYPLVVFGHGFATTPGLYAPLLDAWTRAGYVVAAPLFPVENARAPGGPDESDLVNQPGDVSFVISRLLAADRTPGSRLHGLIDPRRIAVAGQSDGAETAFAVGYERGYADPRVRACLVLSGAILPGEPVLAGPQFRDPPLLAVQGTADRINPPALTEELYRDAVQPKYLLWLLGAGHLPPYSTNARQLAVVERVTIAFLNLYLAHGSPQQLAGAAVAPGVARLVSDP